MKSELKKAKIAVYLNTCRVLALAELKRNLVVLLLPAPIWVGLQIYQWRHSFSPLGLSGTWTMLTMAALFAMTYGLQCFSNETDQRTLDFILTQPLSPYLIITVKYGLSLGCLLGWSAIFYGSTRLSWQLLPLVEGMGPAWILLIMLMIQAISCFSGLLARGLERFFVITVMTGSLAGICYFLWTSCLNLWKANIYWFDILPGQLNLIKIVIPTYLALLCLATPLIGTAWQLRSRIPLRLFNPAKWLGGFWLVSFGIVLLCLRLFAPPVWPDATAFYGDWHQKAGILLSGPVKLAAESSVHKIKNDRVTACRINLVTQLGRKSRRVFSGTNIIRPLFAPDGLKIVFCEQRRLKILDLHSRHVTLVGPGDVAAWSADSRQLICARQINKQNLSQLYLYDLITKKTTNLHQNLPVSNMVWDAPHATVYSLGYQTEVNSLNLKTRKITTYPPRSDREKPLNYYGIVVPNMIIVPETGAVVWGQIYEDELRIFELNPQNGVIKLAENLVSSRMKNAAPVLINHNYQAFIWQRQDGSFVYQATRYGSRAVGHEHHHHGPESFLNSR
jgi:hypothetical protein